MKPKVALVKDGFLPAGSENRRGRLSLEAKARLAELVALGWDIDGLSAPKPVTEKPEAEPSKPGITPVDGTSSARGSGKVIVEIPDERYPENEFRAFAGGKEIGMRDVCNTCGNSFTHNVCSNPTKWIDFETSAPVEFRRV